MTLTPLPLDASAVTHGIQLAVAPVFLLTAVSGMIAAVAGRLARIIDRARVVESSARGNDDSIALERAAYELRLLRRRARLTNLSIALLTTCAFLIGVTIIVLFLGETLPLQTGRVAVGSFLLGVLCFLLALLCFFTETVIATRLLNWRVSPPSVARP